MGQTKILIVDDVELFLELEKSFLTEFGYDVLMARSGEEALELMANESPDLLLLDIMMGRGAEGVMIARKMRKDPVLNEMPVLIITGIRAQIAFLFPGQIADRNEHPREFVHVIHVLPNGHEPGGPAACAHVDPQGWGVAASDVNAVVAG